MTVKERDRFFGEVCFFLSVSNVIFSTWLLARTPWHYFLYHIFKNVIYIANTFIRNVKRKWQWFLADFCYTVNYWSFLYFGVCFLKANIPQLSPLNTWLNPHGPQLFRVAFVWSTGVLGSSVALFTNAMVFHSPAHMAILAIHVGPPLVCWSMRWHPEQLHAAYPDTFHTGCYSLAENCDLTWYDTMLTPLAFYFVLWTLPYYLLVFHIEAKNIEQNDYVTMFSYYRQAMFGRTRLTRRQEEVAYMAVHGTMCLLSFGIAHLCWHSFAIHTGFLLLLVAVSIWNGATYYFRVCMSKTRLLDQLIKEGKAVRLPDSLPEDRIK